MFVKIVDGEKTREFKVQFVHSAHNIKKAKKDAVPGGLRQFVDNLARSMRRRVSFCEIYEVIDGEMVPVSQGFSMCSYLDQFDKAVGRGYTFSRAMRAADLPVEVKDAICEELANCSYAELRDDYR